MKKIFTFYITYITLFAYLLLNTSCSLVDPMTQAQNLSKKGKHQEAIKVLESELKIRPNSVPIKTLLAQAYSDYGIVLCQDKDKPPRVKYPMAKENFAMALALNPNLEDAKDMYKMIEQIQAVMKAKRNE